MLAKLGVPFAGLVAFVVSNVDFSGTVGLGSILVGMLVTILAGAMNFRTRYFKDQIEGWKGNWEQEKAHAAQLEERLGEAVTLADSLRAELADARVVIQRLEQLPNLERVIKLMSDMQERQEERAHTRHTEVLAAIQAAH